MLDVGLLLEWLAIDSTTGNEARYLQALESTLAGAGLRTERQPVADQRWNLLAHGDRPPRILFSTHVDTVPPWFGPTDDGETIRARGACDTKGGLFAMWEAWRALPTAVRDDVGFLLVVGEEVDHIGAIVAAKREYAGLDAIVLCEPTRNLLATGQKGILKGTVRAAGRAGHSAFPEVGESAIHTLVDGLSRLVGHGWPVDPTLGPTTVNVGTIAGGVAANVFAPSAEAEILFRVTGDLDALLSEARSVLGTALELEPGPVNPAVPLVHWPGFGTDVIPFNTDAPYLMCRAPVVLVGPGDIRTAHSPDEHITRRDIAEGIAVYDRLVRGLLGGDLPIGAG